MKVAVVGLGYVGTVHWQHAWLPMATTSGELTSTHTKVDDDLRGP